MGNKYEKTILKSVGNLSKKSWCQRMSETTEHTIKLSHVWEVDVQTHSDIGMTLL